jgi:hypothetical protein
MEQTLALCLMELGSSHGSQLSLEHQLELQNVQSLLNLDCVTLHCNVSLAYMLVKLILILELVIPMVLMEL